MTAAPEPTAIEGEQLDALNLAIQRLPEELRVVLVMAVLDGRTSSEIGALLGRPAGTVRYQLAQARQQLARDLRLQEQEVEDTAV